MIGFDKGNMTCKDRNRRRHVDHAYTVGSDIYIIFRLAACYGCCSVDIQLFIIVSVL